jgi:hypothetical protein
MTSVDATGSASNASKCGASDRLVARAPGSPGGRQGDAHGPGQAREGRKLAPNPRDPPYFETASTLPVDFHSFRRAFNTALAEAGVDVQRAMQLAARSDPRVHARYVMRTAAMREIPSEALPSLAAVAPSREGSDPRAEAAVEARIVTGRDDSTEIGRPLERHVRVTSQSRKGFVAPTAGLEPATRRLTAACSTN